MAKHARECARECETNVTMELGNVSFFLFRDMLA